MKMEKKTKSWNVTIMASATLCIFLMMQVASAYPVTPFTLVGSAEINGRPVPAGSVITAEIDGVAKGYVIVETEGVYGDRGTETKLAVQNGNNGDEIVFKIQTPQMANTLPSLETATYKGGILEDLDLTFEGSEVPKPPSNEGSDSSGGGSSGVGSSGGLSLPGGDETIPGEDSNSTGEQEEPVLQLPTLGRTLYADLTNGPVEVEMENRDTVIITLGQEDYPVLLKTIGDFSVLLENAGNNIVVGAEESREIDLDGDGKADVTASLDKFGKSKVTMTLSAMESGFSLQSITGLVSANPIAFGGLAVFVIAAIGGGLWLKRNRRVENEEDFEYSYN
jgi:hypothetical protein